MSTTNTPTPPHLSRRDAGQGLSDETEGNTAAIEEVLGAGHRVHSGADETRTAVSWRGGRGEGEGDRALRLVL